MAADAMRRVTLRNISAHRLRLVLSVVAVVLGTAFVTGSLVFTSTLKSTFEGLLADGMDGISAQVAPADRQSPGVPVDVVDRARTLPGVADVQADVSGTAVLLTADGTAYQSGGAPTEGLAWLPEDEQIVSVGTLTEGREPRADDEIVLQRKVLDTAGLRLGGHARVYTPARGTIDTTVVGTFTSDSDSGGYVAIGFSPKRATELFTDGDHVRDVVVRAADGVGEEQVRDTLAEAFPDQQVLTGSEVRDQASRQLGESLKFINYFFVTFGLVALLVGTFIIYNTFSMLVAQRLRELGLLRAIGASRGQITGSVLAEAVLTGLLGSLIGIVAGLGLALGIFRVMELFDLGIPAGSLTVTPSSLLPPLVLGVVVTVVSAWVPARKAGRVAPVAAMRIGPTAEGDGGAMRTVVGVYALVAGVALAIIGTWNDVTKPGAITVGVGAFAVILGTFLVMPALARPIAGGIGRVIGAPFGAIGRLAATNAGRNTRRTAATAFALTLGLTLVAAFGTLGATTRASVDRVVEAGFRGEVTVRGVPAQGQPVPLPGDIGTRIAGVEGVAEVVQLSVGFARFGTEPGMLFGVTGPIEDVLDLGMTQGSATPGERSMVVSESTARDRGWQMGSTVDLTGADGTEIPVTVTGIYGDDLLVGPYYVGGDVYDELVAPAQRSTAVVMVKGEEGRGPEEIRDGIATELKDMPVAMVQTKDEGIATAGADVDQLLTIIYALLGLALVVAVLGIINTLALSVIERRTEIGMLRAVGMQRSQVRLSINLESTQIAVFGAVVGAVIGAFLGWAFVTVLARDGLVEAQIPWGTIAVVLVSSAVVGVLASLWPAHRAARTSPLEAIAD